MTEDEAKAWMRSRCTTAQFDALERFATLLREEATMQNLVSPATLPLLWSRHIVDSAQLLEHAQGNDGAWADVGTGAGFPGVVVAALQAAPMTLIEPRARRVAFLQHVVDELSMSHVRIEPRKAEGASGTYRVISARAVASVPALLEATTHLRDRSTVMIFPRGKGAQADLESLPARWQRMFHVEQSITDAASLILVARGAP